MKKIQWVLCYACITIAIIVIVGILYIALMSVYCIVGEQFSHEVCLSCSIAISTLAFTALEYYRKKSADKTNLLLTYNKRYVNDRRIQSVIKYLQVYDESRGKREVQPGAVIEPNHTDFILFARFFEELQIALEKNNFDKKEICRLFAYYAIEAYDEHSDKIGNIEEDESWKKFRDFCESMKKVEDKLNISHK